MSDATIALVTLAVVIAVFLWNRLPVGIVAIGGVLGALAGVVSSPLAMPCPSGARWPFASRCAMAAMASPLRLLMPRCVMSVGR